MAITSMTIAPAPRAARCALSPVICLHHAGDHHLQAAAGARGGDVEVDALVALLRRDDALAVEELAAGAAPRPPAPRSARRGSRPRTAPRPWSAPRRGRSGGSSSPRFSIRIALVVVEPQSVARMDRISRVGRGSMSASPPRLVRLRPPPLRSRRRPPDARCADQLLHAPRGARASRAKRGSPERTAPDASGWKKSSACAAHERERLADSPGTGAPAPPAAARPASAASAIEERLISRRQRRRLLASSLAPARQMRREPSSPAPAAKASCTVARVPAAGAPVGRKRAAPPSRAATTHAERRRRIDAERARGRPTASASRRTACGARCRRRPPCSAPRSTAARSR